MICNVWYVYLQYKGLLGNAKSYLEMQHPRSCRHMYSHLPHSTRHACADVQVRQPPLPRRTPSPAKPRLWQTMGLIWPPATSWCPTLRWPPLISYRCAAPALFILVCCAVLEPHTRFCHASSVPCDCVLPPREQHALWQCAAS